MYINIITAMLKCEYLQLPFSNVYNLLAVNLIILILLLYIMPFKLSSPCRQEA